jgi:hypothetical protein
MTSVRLKCLTPFRADRGTPRDWWRVRLGPPRERAIVGCNSGMAVVLGTRRSSTWAMSRCPHAPRSRSDERGPRGAADYQLRSALATWLEVSDHQGHGPGTGGYVPSLIASAIPVRTSSSGCWGSSGGCWGGGWLDVDIGPTGIGEPAARASEEIGRYSRNGLRVRHRLLARVKPQAGAATNPYRLSYGALSTVSSRDAS